MPILETQYLMFLHFVKEEIESAGLDILVLIWQ